MSEGKGNIYSFPFRLERRGMGTIALHALRSISSGGLLQKIISAGIEPGGPWREFSNSVSSFPAGLLSRIPVPLIKDEFFDLFASAKVDRCLIFHCFSGCGLHSLRRAKRTGAKVVLESQQSHRQVFDGLVDEECRTQGVMRTPGDLARKGRFMQEYREADHILTYSSFAQGGFVKNGIPEEKLLKIPLGVDTDRFRPAPNGPDEFTVLFVGNDPIRKGLIYLLEAWEILNLKSARLIVCGRFLPNLARRVNRYRGRIGIDFVGYRPDLLPLYQSSSVLVLPSIEDCFPMTVTEAMACGLPVIITENVGSRDLVENGREGFVVPLRNPKSLVEAMRYLQENPSEARRMGTAARRRVEEYTWSKYEERIAAMYKNIMAS